MERLATDLIEWLRQRVEAAGAKGVVFGLSGGIDSAVVGGLCQRAFGERCLGLIMPCHSDRKDEEDATLVASTLGIPAKTVALDRVYEQLVLELTGKPYQGERSLALANIKPRLRMITLYFHAAEHGYLVVGTGNKSELTVGYFTKYGDGGVDLLPLGNTVKGEVRQLAEYLGVPSAIIARPPTAGLWEAQTDEGEMGLSYRELDRYIRTGEAEEHVKERVAQLAGRSRHKLSLPPMPPFPVGEDRG